MRDYRLLGIDPWLPWPLNRSRWWTEPVRAERLAALRIGVAAVLLLDVLGTYLPQAHDFFGANSLGSPDVFASVRIASRWSLLTGIANPFWMQGVLLVWAGAAACLLVGLLPNLSAAVAWVLSVSVMGLNYYLHNSGDNVRTIELFYLMLCPCGAAWSLSGRGQSFGKRVYVAAWPVRLLLVQLVIIYFVNGVYKLAGSSWRDGDVLHTVLSNLAWTRFSYSQLGLPELLLRLLTWTTLLWEVSFPLLVLSPRTRAFALCLGVFFHVGTGVLLRLTMFPLYMLCLYLPLVPWERGVDAWRDRRDRRAW
jgi:hypothetical protein